MNVGERIRQLRTERNLTQPQLAEAIGIEQSYLSKLENDKSVPSADIFQAMLRAFALDTAGFLAGIDDHLVHRHLRQIPEVANHLNANAATRIHSIRNWLFGSAIACGLGLTAVVAGYRGLLFSDTQYGYYSQGVVLPGEPTDVYRKLATFGAAQDPIQARIREDYFVTDVYRGEVFVVPVEGGSRTYSFTKQTEHQRPANRYLMLLGTVLAFAGLLGFVVEYRLRSVPRSRAESMNASTVTQRAG